MKKLFLILFITICFSQYPTLNDEYLSFLQEYENTLEDDVENNFVPRPDPLKCIKAIGDTKKLYTNSMIAAENYFTSKGNQRTATKKTETNNAFKKHLLCQLERYCIGETADSIQKGSPNYRGC
jgi:hypothetical protein